MPLEATKMGRVYLYISKDKQDRGLKPEITVKYAFIPNVLIYIIKIPELNISSVVYQ